MAAVTERVRAATGEPLRMVLTLMGREIRDTLRDWRIVVPTVILTLFFPALMSFVADAALDWVARYGAPIIGERMLPFLLMIVGFFPISFSLVIALETFVGEKERRSLEPLLATPFLQGLDAAADLVGADSLADDDGGVGDGLRRGSGLQPDDECASG